MGFTPERATSILKREIPSTTYIGLSTTTPTEAGGNFTEPDPATTDYARVPFGDAYDTSVTAQISNKEILFFNEALAAYGTVTHFGLFTAKTGGTPFFVGEIKNAAGDAGQAVNTGYVPIFRKHKLVIGLDKEELETYE